MARLFHSHDMRRRGKLDVSKPSAIDLVEVYYIPPLEQVERSHVEPKEADAHRVKLLEINVRDGRLSMFPIDTLGERSSFLKPKYKKIKQITLEGATPIFSDLNDITTDSATYSKSITFDPTVPLDHSIDEAHISEAPTSGDEIVYMLESLPPAFTKDYDYGLGLAKPYRFIIDAIEELCDCSEVVISHTYQTGPDRERGVFYISNEDFDTVRRALNSTTSISQSVARSVKESETYNFFAQKMGRPLVPVGVGRHPLRKLLTAAVRNGGAALSGREQDEVIGALSKNVKAISVAKPIKLVRLQRDIELVNLEGLIERFRKMMNQGCAEMEWQGFFEENPFALGMAFGCPIIKVRERASVGGRTLTGSGDKIADFLVKNSMTNNTAIVEIKTPGTKLLSERSYRDGVFTPLASLTGAINQALDQKYRFEREIVQIKENSKTYDIESYSVHCCLLIGSMPVGDDQRKSFEIFRRNSKDVEIITFDELLEKLKSLYEFLAAPESEEPRDDQPFDVPF